MSDFSPVLHHRAFLPALILLLGMARSEAVEAGPYERLVVKVLNGGSLEAMARPGSKGSLVLRFPEGKIRISSRCLGKRSKLTPLTAEELEAAEEVEKAFLAARKRDASFQKFCAGLPEAKVNAYLVRCLLAEDKAEVRKVGTHEVRARKATWIFELVAFGAGSDLSAKSGARRLRSSKSWRRLIRHQGGDIFAPFRVTSSYKAQLLFPEGEIRMPFNRVLGLGAPKSRYPRKPSDLKGSEEVPPAKPTTKLPEPKALARACAEISPKSNALLLRGFLAGGAHRQAVLPLLKEPERRWLVRLIAHQGKRPAEAVSAAGKLRRAWAERRWAPGVVTLGKKKGLRLACEFYAKPDGQLRIRLGELVLKLRASDYSKTKATKAAPEVSIPREFPPEDFSGWISSTRTPEGNARILAGLLHTRAELQRAAAQEAVDLRRPELLLLVLERSGALGAATWAARGLLTLQGASGKRFEEVFLGLTTSRDRWRAALGIRALARMHEEGASSSHWEKSLADHPTRLALLWLHLGKEARVHKLLGRLIREQSTKRLSSLFRILANTKRPFPTRAALKVVETRKSYTLRHAALDGIRASQDVTAVPGLVELLDNSLKRDSRRARGLALHVESTLRALTRSDLSGPEAWEEWLSSRGEFIDSLDEDVAAFLDLGLATEDRLAALRRLKRTNSGAAILAYGEVLSDSETPAAITRSVAEVLAEAGVREAWATRPLLNLLSEPETYLTARNTLRRIYGVDFAGFPAWEATIAAHARTDPLAPLGEQP